MSSLVRRVCTLPRYWLRSLHDSGSLWSAAETFAYPLLLLVLTPVLLVTIGTDGFGLWVLTYSIAGFGGVLNFGLGLTTQRFVARARGGGAESLSLNQATTVITQTLLLAAIGGAVVALILLVGARSLADAFFQRMGMPTQVILSIQVAAVVTASQQIETVFASGLRGLERFDLAAKSEAIAKTAGTAAVIGTALWIRSVESVLIMTGIFAVVAVAAKAALLMHALKGTNPVFSWRFPNRAVLRFGLWTWLQGISGTVFQQADRLLVSVMLGASALANYSVASQIGALIHVGLSAMFAVVFPRLSRQLASDDSAITARHLSETWHRCIGLNITVVVLVGVPLWLFGPELLHLWLRDAATPEALQIYPLVLCAFLLLSMNVAPHFVLLGAGGARYTSLANVAGALLAIAVLYPAVSMLGLEGAALARGLYGLVLIVSYFIVLRWVRALA